MKKQDHQRAIRPKTTLPDIYHPPSRRVPLPPYRHRARFMELFIISLFVATFLLLAIGAGVILFAQNGLVVFAPTPTPTATGAPLPTETPDVQTAQFIEDLLTKVAYAEANPGQLLAPPPVPIVVFVGEEQTPIPQPTTIPTASLPQETISPDITDPITDTSVTIAIPIVPSGGAGSSVPENPGIPPTEIPTNTPIPVQTATPAPTELAIPIVNPPDPPAQNTPTPVPTSTLVPTLAPTPVTAINLRGVVRVSELLLRLGPSSAYDAVENGVFGRDAEVEIRGRTETGEWVYICCAGEKSGWVRLADVPLKADALPANAPEGAETPDIRWVQFQPVDGALTPVPTPTAIPVDEFPLYGYNTTNQGKLPTVPYLNLNEPWQIQASGTQPFSSPAIVWQGDILIASQDNQFYNINRATGEQNWRYPIGETVQFAPAVQDNSIYLVTPSGRIINLADGGGSGFVDWEMTLPDGYKPASGINIANEVLFISGTKGDGTDRVFVVNRANGEIIRQIMTTGSDIQYPAIGNELLYVGNQHIWAIDIRNEQEAWVNTAVNNVSTAPIYSYPGVRALAELYVADKSNKLFSLDANTGKESWNFNTGALITAIAADDTKVYVAGNGFIKAISRQDGVQQWEKELPGGVQGRIFVDNTHIFVATNSSKFQILNANDGTLVIEKDTSASIVGAPAISGSWIFVAGNDNRLRGYQSTP